MEVGDGEVLGDAEEQSLPDELEIAGVVFGGTAMSEERMDEFDKENFRIGYSEGGDIMIVTIPMKKWAEDPIGDVYVSGVFTKAERVALKNIRMFRDAKAKAGLITPGGNGKSKTELEVA